MLAVKVNIHRFVDEAQPGWVECELIDVHGTQCLFIEKVPVVTVANLNSDSHYPQLGTIACQVLNQSSDSEIVTIDTSIPYGIVSISGQTQFQVHSSQLLNLE